MRTFPSKRIVASALTYAAAVNAICKNARHRSALHVEKKRYLAENPVDRFASIC